MSLSDWISDPRRADQLDPLATAATDGDEKTTEASLGRIVELSSHWLILEGPRRSERWFTPAATRAELESRYPGALLIPLPDEPTERRASHDQEGELRCVVELVAAANQFTDAETQEALEQALADPEAALRSFQGLAHDLKSKTLAAETVRLWVVMKNQDGGEHEIAIDIPRRRYDGVAILELLASHLKEGDTRIVSIVQEGESPLDDRVTCKRCNNLLGSLCSAATRGEMSGYPHDYRPATEIRRRCEGFKPKPGDPDQRDGRMRWPGLLTAR